MTLVDLLVLAVVALAALRGWRHGGTGLVLRAAGAVAGVLALGAVARWYDAASTPLAVAAALVGAVLGWAVGRTVAARLARRSPATSISAGRPRPGLPDRVLGVAAHGALALLLCVAAAGIVATTGPPSVADAAARSGVLAAAAQRLPAPATLVASGLQGRVR